MILNPDKYSRSKLNLDPLKVRKLEELNPYRPWFDLGILYLVTFLLVHYSLVSTEYSKYFYFPLIFFIAGRQGAILQLIHEASHNLINKNKKINNFFGSWLTSYLIGVNYDGFTSGHQSHHSNTGTDSEPTSDSEKYIIVDFKNPKIYMLFIKDLLGITALKIFFNYGNDKLNNDKIKIQASKNLFVKKKLLFLTKLTSVQLIILYFFNFNLIYYFLFWIYPAMGPHMFLMRIRGIAEHGLGKKLGKVIQDSNSGRYYTRSFLTNRNLYSFKFFTILEKMLIGSYNVNYHHEHHLNSKIPYYNLKKFHELVSEEISTNIKPERNSEIYEKGYFSAALSKTYIPIDDII